MPARVFIDTSALPVSLCGQSTTLEALDRKARTEREHTEKHAEHTEKHAEHTEKHVKHTEKHAEHAEKRVEHLGTGKRSALGLVGLVSVYCDWVRSVWQHVKLSSKIRP